ncbi:hypothetical protein HJ581_0040980 [Rhodococcus opacus]|nr:hypothetical protein [Rhodococcus opacus]WKN60175.1 hypothetical protein HJ581_0040980 [Rhodococcus opacus]
MELADQSERRIDRMAVAWSSRSKPTKDVAFAVAPSPHVASSTMSSPQSVAPWATLTAQPAALNE